MYKAKMVNFMHIVVVPTTQNFPCIFSMKHNGVLSTFLTDQNKNTVSATNLSHVQNIQGLLELLFSNEASSICVQHQTHHQSPVSQYQFSRYNDYHKELKILYKKYSIPQYYTNIKV